MLSSTEQTQLQRLVGDRYQPLALLGKKAGRKTLLAEDLETSAKVVIKLLTFGEDFAWEDLKLFEREAETLRSLAHAAIPKYLDYFDVKTPRSNGFALVQSYIKARSLEEQVKAGRRFSEEELEQIAEQLLEILAYLHSRQPAVIHRDIKPSNVLLTDRTAHSVGQVYLVDFGSVQTLAAREGGTITVVGTYGYMPPEQFGGRAVPASDLYSLGATLIYLASGRHPADLPQDELRLKFEPFVQLSPKIVGWLKTLISPGLSGRFQSAEEAIAKQQLPSQSSSTEGQDEGLLEKAALFPIKFPIPKSGSPIDFSQRPDELKFCLPVRKIRLKVAKLKEHLNLNFILIFALIIWPFAAIIIGSLLMFAFEIYSLKLALIMLGAALVIGIRLSQGSSKKSTLRIDEKRIYLENPSRRNSAEFMRHHAWKIVINRKGRLKLLIGLEQMQFSLCLEDSIWLGEVLGQVLSLPVEDEEPPKDWIGDRPKH